MDSNAVIFRKSDVEDLNEKLQMLLDDTALVQQYKKTTADYICEKYGWDRVVEKTVEVYRRALK